MNLRTSNIVSDNMVSVQIPTYNQKIWVKRAVESVFFQTYSPLQIIVADDCSKQYDIFKHLEEYCDEPRTEIRRNLNNLGRVSNYRNILYNYVRGVWFMNLDGDDKFEKVQFLSKAMDYINNSSYEVVAFEFNHRLSYIKQYIRWYKDIDEETIIVKGSDYLMLQKYYQNFMHANTIFRTSAAKKVDFYNMDILSADYFSAMKIWTQGYVMLSSKKIFKWNDHGGNASHTISLSEIEKEKIAIDDLLLYAKQGLSVVETKELKQTLLYFLYLKVFAMYKSKNKDLRYYIYLVQNFKINKFYIKKILTELTS